MAEIKFACPHCQQHIQADQDYAGMQITCPACSGPMMVPGQRASAAAPSTVPAPLTVPEPAPGPVTLHRAATTTAPATAPRPVPGRTSPAVNPAAPRRSGWYMSPWPYIGVAYSVIGILYFLGRNDLKMCLAYLSTALLYSLAVHIAVAVAAFGRGVGTGLMSLCIPFYALYFVFWKQKSDTLKILYGSVVLVNIFIRVMPTPAINS